MFLKVWFKRPVCTTWERGRNANSQVPPHSKWTEPSGGKTRGSMFTRFHRHFCPLESKRHSAEPRCSEAERGGVCRAQGAGASVFLNTKAVGLVSQQDEITHLGRFPETRRGCSWPGLREGPIWTKGENTEVAGDPPFYAEENRGWGWGA